MTSAIVVTAIRAHLNAAALPAGGPAWPVVDVTSIDPLVAERRAPFLAIEPEGADERLAGLGTTTRHVREDGLLPVHLFVPDTVDLTTARAWRDAIRDACADRWAAPWLRLLAADPEPLDRTLDRRWWILTTTLAYRAHLQRT